MLNNFVRGVVNTGDEDGIFKVEGSKSLQKLTGYVVAGCRA